MIMCSDVEKYMEIESINITSGKKLKFHVSYNSLIVLMPQSSFNLGHDNIIFMYHVPYDLTFIVHHPGMATPCTGDDDPDDLCNMSTINDFRMIMMMGTKVRTGFEVVQLHSCDEDLLCCTHAH